MQLGLLADRPTPPHMDPRTLQKFSGNKIRPLAFPYPFKAWLALSNDPDNTTLERFHQIDHFIWKELRLPFGDAVFIRSFNQNLTDQQGNPVDAPRFLAEKGVSAVISGTIPDPTAQTLNTMNITPIGGIFGTVASAINNYRVGILRTPGKNIIPQNNIDFTDRNFPAQGQGNMNARLNPQQTKPGIKGIF